jgi:hypothetical protein
MSKAKETSKEVTKDTTVASNVITVTPENAMLVAVKLLEQINKNIITLTTLISNKK